MLSDPDFRPRRERRMRPPRGERHEQRPSNTIDIKPITAPLSVPAYTSRARAASVPAPVPERLPWQVNCVLARRDPGQLVVDLWFVRQHVRELTTVLGRGTTYHVNAELEGAREQVYDVANHINLLRRQVYTGRCGRLRKREEYRGYVSVRDRDVLGDGGLRMIGRALNELADAMRKLRGREPFYVRVRDSDLSSTRDRITTYTGRVADTLKTIAVDVSAADLSGRTDLASISLENVIWSAQTAWPPSLAPLVQASSRPLCRDIFHMTRG